ncbi:MAG: HNH endonuclease [Planctomycetia bacterium]|nr:HNH endonuclease [Planctomycetia bacterium]
MDAKLRAAVYERAAQCCEYCRRQQVDSPLIPFHVEHIIPRKHGGDDALENLCLACPDCNLQKGSDLTGIDPQTGMVTRLFNPRAQQWSEHFAWEGVRIVGTTATGRTTVHLLDLNSPARLRLRLAASRE